MKQAARSAPALSRIAAALGGRLPGGGSFNPAHRGHLEISRAALKRLGLDQVWWLVSPQNPLKPERGMAPLGQRLTGARRLARDLRIRASALESALGTAYTADTVSALARRFPRCHFVWLMGADNLVQISAWKDWETIFRTLPVAVFDRPSYSLASPANACRRRRRAAWRNGHRRPGCSSISG
jgi:nicotinate-nucleotide adenylyltransferase